MSLPTYTFDELKKAAKSFLDRLPTASPEAIENGWKMFCLTYLNTEMTDLQRESEGPMLYLIIHRKYEESQQTPRYCGIPTRHNYG